MTIYQKAIKVRKECESREVCANCPYDEDCLKSNIIFFIPCTSNIKEIAKAIKEEKWNVK